MPVLSALLLALATCGPSDPPPGSLSFAYAGTRFAARGPADGAGRSPKTGFALAFRDTVRGRERLKIIAGTVGADGRLETTALTLSDAGSARDHVVRYPCHDHEQIDACPSATFVLDITPTDASGAEWPGPRYLEGVVRVGSVTDARVRGRFSGQTAPDQIEGDTLDPIRIESGEFDLPIVESRAGHAALARMIAVRRRP